MIELADFYRQAEYYWGRSVAQIGSVMVSGVFWLVKCLLFLRMWVISFLCPFPLSCSLRPTFPHLPLWWRAMQGKWNQIEEKNGTLIFFLSSLNSWWCFQVSPFSRIILSFLLPAMSRVVSVITSHNSLPIHCTVLWWGLRRSWLFIKGNKVCVCVFFRAMLQLTCTWWPRTQKILPTPPMYWK